MTRSRNEYAKAYRAANLDKLRAYTGDDLNPNHYSFPRVSNHRTPGWFYPATHTGDRWVFWAVMLTVLGWGAVLMALIVMVLL